MPETTLTSAHRDGPARLRARPMALVAAALPRVAMLALLIILVGVSRALYPGLLEPNNILNILSQNAQVGIIAVGMTFVMIAGGFDLSVGAVYAAGATFYASQAQQWPLTIAALLTLLMGALAGLINGLIITRLRVNAFVATLGTASAFGGATFLYAHSTPVIVDDPAFATLGTARWFGIPISVWVLLAVLAAGSLALSRTVYGRSLYAVGGNAEAARLAGLRIDRLRVTSYVLASMLAALGGMIIASRLGLGQPDIAGNTALDAIAIVVIGGTSLFGGSGTVWKTAIGLLILATLTNLFDSLGLDSIPFS